MTTPSFQPLATAVLAAPGQFVLALTGGGSGALSALLQTPGASRAVLEAIVPYSAAALADWLGSSPEQACSTATARGMAMTAWRRARILSASCDDSVSDAPFGAAATASLATDRPKRGPHRLHVALQSIGETSEWQLTFDAGRRDRADEEHLATQLILLALAHRGDLEVAHTTRRALESQLTPAESLNHQTHAARSSWCELFVGERSSVRLIASKSPPRVVFPGSFNPVHAGHLEMSRIAERRLGAKASWEISIDNVDKPPLDYLTIAERIEDIRGHDALCDVVLTSAPTFREKGALFPHAAFVVGADTIARIADARYYDDLADRDAAIDSLRRHNCRFLVFGRLRGEQFDTLDDLALPSSLRSICDEVSPAEFRIDISSTSLR